MGWAEILFFSPGVWYLIYKKWVSFVFLLGPLNAPLAPRSKIENA
jgi:hypothetical protein